jgi:hypothetical protein
MVKKITVIPVNNNSNDEIIQQDEEITNVQEEETHEENIIKLEDDITREQEEITTNVELVDEPKTKGKKKVLNKMPTTEKVLTQVQCQACGKSMSEKNLKYSHAAFCIKRVQEADKPKTIPAPKKIMKKLTKLKMVKEVQADEELYDEEGRIFKGSIIPSENIRESSYKTITLSEFNNMEIKRLEALKRPTYEVRMKTAKEKKQEKYDKLASNAF